MTATSEMGIESLVLNISDEIHVKASIEKTFEAMLLQLGPENETPERKMPMKLEAWPGGRWYRDLGDGNGHLWAHVQSIKRPTLLEFTGPLMLSFGVVSNVQYRLSEEKGGTLIRFHHKAIGAIPEDHRRGMTEGWKQWMTRMKQRAESGK